MASEAPPFWWEPPDWRAYALYPLSRVYSFVAPSPVYDFNSDVKQFWNYLANTQGYPASRQYLLSKLAQDTHLYVLY